MRECYKSCINMACTLRAEASVYTFSSLFRVVTDICLHRYTSPMKAFKCIKVFKMLS